MGKPVNIIGSINSFVRAVESGTIAAAARSLGISAAAVSQNIARLEAHLDARLLSRTTRQMALTDAGALYYEKVRHIPRELDLARQAVSDGMDLQDHLCIATTSAFGRHVLAPLLPAFHLRYPRLTIELLSADHRVNHLQERVDVSIRIAAQLEERLVARLIASRPFMVCASPCYLERAGWPTSPEDLQNHACLVLRYPTDGRFLPWGFVRDGLRFDAPVNAEFISDDIDMLAQMAVNGAGITRLASFVAQPLIEKGLLVRLFDDCRHMGAHAVPEPMQLYACVTDYAALTPKVRAFIDYVQAHLDLPDLAGDASSLP
jgi:DNA-binding transcriptional LysR family regulator